MTPRRKLLRDGTRTLHERLDRSLGGFDCLPEYRDYIAAMARFRDAAETTEIRIRPDDAQFVPTRVRRELRADRRDLHIPAGPPIQLSLQSHRECWLGMCYVLEGSGFGARLILARATEFGFDESYGARHLARMAAAGQNWQDFLIELENATDLDMDRTLDAANQVFAAAIEAAGRTALAPAG